MLSQARQHTLTRRTSKLLVEMIIGIIGVLGIMLAQIECSPNNSNRLQLDNGNAISANVTKVTSQIDWLEILF